MELELKLDQRGQMRNIDVDDDLWKERERKWENESGEL